MLIKLVIQCILDLTYSMGFFIMWIVVNSLIFQALGMEFFEDDYGDMSMLPTYIMFTYRNTIGDLDAPVYSKWVSIAEDHPKNAWVMIILIWAFWLLN